MLSADSIDASGYADGLIVHGEGGGGRLDLGREVYALLGFAFDALDINQTLQVLRGCIDDRTPCFLTTANLNFIVNALHDSPFRQTALRSDLCVADGMPIVWIARLMGIPIKHRASGADLFERLRNAPHKTGDPVIKIYLFGGPPGAAASACANINASGGLLKCVGFETPGYVSVEAMSTREQLARVNASEPDFVIAALGAVKGQAWLHRNRGSIRAPVLSHLGAVINFEAGTIARAPSWVARSGFEWAWRIAQEPALWRRYLRDGFVVGRWLVQAILPWLARSRWRPWSGRATVAASFELADSTVPVTYHLHGAWTQDALPPLRRSIADSLNQGREVQLDLSGVTAIDSAAVGLLLVLDAWQQQPRAVKTGHVLDPAVTSALRAFGASSLISEAGNAASP